jgi:3-deoxy-D-arabino-heptulosonate 7-phosphate (DAHP) synthase
MASGKQQLNTSEIINVMAINIAQQRNNNIGIMLRSFRAEGRIDYPESELRALFAAARTNKSRLAPK